MSERFTSTARVPTTHGSRYLQQLCKHWSHSLKVESTDAHGTITFPRDARGADWPADGVATLVATPDALMVQVDGSAPDHRDALEDVLARHLDRFAFREAPLSFDWQRD